VLVSQLVLPSVAARAGYVWREPRLETALQRIFNPHATGKPPLLHAFSARQFVPRPVDEVFAFFSDARNLEAITPPSLRFAVTGGAPDVREGSVIDYDLHLHGVALKWKTLILEWNPPHAFVDVQLRGPYALWEHRHTFEEIPGGTVIADDVTYALPFAPLGGVAQPFVQRNVEEIFRYRREEIARRFGTGDPLAAVPS
jgi:ligand-binding SRPBCC domain-containing protein